MPRHTPQPASEAPPPPPGSTAPPPGSTAPPAPLETTLETLRARAAALPPWLQGHIGRVVTEGRRLAQLHEVDPQRVQAAAWGHDLYRHLDGPALIAEAAALGMAPDAAERAAPILLHGPIAAQRAERDWGVTDAAVLEAIRFHTTAKPAMSAVALTLFLADKLEPAKVSADPGLAGIRTLAAHDPVAALLALLDRRIAAHLAAGMVTHPLAVEARNWALGQAHGQPSSG